MNVITYARLEEVLTSLGFSFRGIYEKNRIFRHAETGALVIYPEFPADSPALPHHLSAAQAILNAYGLADPDAFLLELHGVK